MRKIQSGGRKVALLASAGFAALVIATGAQAQEVQADGDLSVVEPQEPGQPEEGEAIVVTGSRIATVTPYNSPDPISIVSPEIALKEGRLDLASALQSSPVAAGSTQITAALSSNFVTNGGPGAQTITIWSSHHTSLASPGS